MARVDIRFTRRTVANIAGEATIEVPEGQDWHDAAELAAQRNDFIRFLPVDVDFDDGDDWEFELDTEE